MKESQTLLSILEKSSAYLEKYGVDMARLNAEIIISKCLNMKRLSLYLDYNRPLMTAELEKIRHALILRGKFRTPYEYIFNSADFYGRPFFVDKRVLIPRIETELVVEQALAYICELKNPKILEIGTGSGAIAITLALEKPDAKILAVDISLEALEVAKKNAHTLLADNIEFLESNLFENVEDLDFDLIISNPPYISKEAFKTLPEETLKEPKIALVANNNGLELYAAILEKGQNYLAKDGKVVFEIGYDQKKSLLSLFEIHGYKNYGVQKDYFGNERIASGEKNS